MKPIDYRVPYALSLLLHVTALGLLGLRMSSGDESTAIVTQNAFHVQLLADTSGERDNAWVTDRSTPESVEAIVALDTTETEPVESVAEAATEPVAGSALKRAEPIDTPPEEEPIARIVAKATVPDAAPQEDNYSAQRVVTATLHTDFLDYGEPATASRNPDATNLRSTV